MSVYGLSEDAKENSCFDLNLYMTFIAFISKFVIVPARRSLLYYVVLLVDLCIA